MQVAMRRRVIATGIGLVAALGAPPPASTPGAAAATWSIVSGPSAVIDSGDITSASCPSAATCTAVGSSINSSGTQVALIEAWKSSRWTIQSSPAPPGAQRSSLSGVSCASATACIAVGTYVTSAFIDVTLAEAWNGSNWAIQSTPNPSGAPDSSLAAVSCTSTTACTAVGNYVSSSGTELTLAEAWDGSGWTIQSTPDPSAAQSSSLLGVSCPSAGACSAVGWSSSSDGTELTFAEVQIGTGWTLQATPNPAGSVGSSLSSVSCVAPTVCTAVGRSTDGTGGQLTLAEAWDGTTWALQTPKDPVGAQDNQLSGVSCVQAASCYAVGSSQTTAGVGVPLAESWNGTAWTILSTPYPTGATDSALLGISCVAANACTAVGSYDNSAFTQLALVEMWNGTTWPIQTTPDPSGWHDSMLTAVSCVSVSTCVTVGNDRNAVGTAVVLAGLWNGKRWTTQFPPDPAVAVQSVLSGASCTSTTACTAVGNELDGGSDSGMIAESWNGSAWSLQSTSDPPGASQSALAAVACVSTATCTAVGSQSVNGVEETLVEAWNGSTWTEQTTPNPVGSLGDRLSGVSCPSPGWCTAVGDDFDSGGRQVTLAEAWDGSTWAAQPTPTPSGAVESVLNGVSCSSATSCVAVGKYRDSTGTAQPLTEIWDGSQWLIQAVPNPTGSEASILNGVSCTSSTSCTAVGYYVSQYERSLTLAEFWNGTSWTVQPSANPAGSQATILTGVSCVSAAACTAVGDYRADSGAYLTLAERSS